MNKKKLLSLLLAIVLVFGLAAPATAAYEVPADVSGKLVILHTNDTHGGDVAEEGESIGTAGVAQLKKDFEAAGAEVLLFSAGDAIKGAPVVNQDNGASAISFMNAAGYDAMEPGNHEFDWGTPNLLTIAEKAEFDILCANIVVKATGETLFTANKVYTTASGLKVGVFGLETPDTPTKTSADTTNYTFLGLADKQEMYDCAAAQVKELKAAGADLIVCLAHLGINRESVASVLSIDVAEKVDGIDLIIDGHSHSETDAIKEAIGGDTDVVNGAKIVSTGTKLANVGVVVYDKETKTLTNSYVTAADYSKVDETVAKLVNDRETAVTAELAEIVGKTEVELNGKRNPGNRTEETNLGDFATDAILWQARKEWGEEKVDAAFTNGGGIRETIPVGDISMNIMKTVFPYNNTVSLVELTGTQLLEMLEANCCATPDELGGFPQVSGIEYIIDTTVPYENGERYPDSIYFAPAKPGARVTITSVNGKPWDAEATYALATNDFLISGKDAYGVLLKASKTIKGGTPLETALINYAKEELGGVIGEEYAEPAGRITIKTPTFTDVPAGNWALEAVEYVAENGLMSGMGDGIFTPNGTVTRGMVMTVLARMSGADTTPAEGEAWYQKGLDWCKENDISDGTNPTGTITREQLATMLYRYEQKINEGGFTGEWMFPLDYPDADKVSDYAYEALCWITMKGVVSGDNGNLNPAGNATRAQLATMLMRFTQLAD